MADGKILTGFSYPHVAVYTANGGNPQYSKGMVLARGVSVSLAPEVGDNEDFYANNKLSERSSGTLTGGTLSLTVDGLKSDAEALVFGLPQEEDENGVKVVNYGDNAEAPYVGVGYVTRYVEDGTKTYIATVITKAKFDTPDESAETSAESISYQTQDLSATIMRDDSKNHNWKKVSVPYKTEGEALTALKKLLNIADAKKK